MMKKIMVLGSAMLCSIGIASRVITPAIATSENKTVDAEYTIDSEYSVTIPATITFTKAKESVDEVISASNILIDPDESLKISMQSSNGNLVNGASYIPYSFTAGSVTTPITKETNYEILNVASGNKNGTSKSITFTAGGLEHVVFSGRHADTLTFVVEVGSGGSSPITPTSSLLVSNSDFINGCYYNNGTLRNSDKPFSQVKTHESFITPQKIKIVVTDSENDVTNGKYIAVISAWDSQKQILNPNDFTQSKFSLATGTAIIDLSERYPDAKYFKVDVMSYTASTGFDDIPSTVTINVYSLGGGQDANVSKFANKKIDILGDSITAQAKYIPALKSLTDASLIVNNGVSGEKVTEFTSRVGNLSDDADLIIVFGGTNDYWHHDVNIGSMGDSTNSTFYGALNVIYNALTADHPDAEYLFVFPPHQTFSGKDDTYNWGYGTLNDFRVAMRTFCSTKGIKFFDLGTVTDWDPDVHTSDGVHPNASGGTKLAEEINGFLQANF